MHEKMVKNYKYQNHHWRKGEVYKVVGDEESHCLSLVCGNSVYNKRTTRPKLLYFMLLTFLYCCLILAPQHFTSPSTFSLLYSFGVEDGRSFHEAKTNAFLCSYVPNGTICCDRNSIRTDICIMKGDVRTDSTTSSVFLYRGNGFGDYGLGQSDDDAVSNQVLQHEKIRPYTRKWEPNVMATVGQLDLFVKKGYSGNAQHCDVEHNVTAVFFSTAGYTGNLYHEFNDGIVPLYITTQHLNKQVVFVIVDYHNWWIMKYGDVVAELSDYPVIDFNGDNRTHCFPEAIVGLRIHDDLTIDPSLMEGNKTIGDFRKLLDRAYWPRIKGLIEDEEREAQLLASSPLPAAPGKALNENQDPKRPKLVIIARNGSREITNQGALVKMAEEIGFSVEILIPVKTSELAQNYRVLNASDVLVGVHGAALTHFLFMRPDSVFIQIIALGTDWASEQYFGETSGRFGLKYVGYKILPVESSLYDSYEKDDPVLINPDIVNKRGWEITKQVYLDNQNVRLNLRRFGKVLLRAYYYTVAKKKGHLRLQSR